MDERTTTYFLPASETGTIFSAMPQSLLPHEVNTVKPHRLRNVHLLLFFLLPLAAFAQAPTANFTAAQTAGCAPVVISFQDQSTGSPTAWQWSFGNGNTSTLQSPSTTYFTPGTYTVTLTVSNGGGSNTLTRTGFITVYGKPSVSFLANDSNGCAPFGVRFTDGSTAAAGTANTGWQWDFGNGTSSTAQNPSLVYATPGNYTVNLKVTNDKGCFASLAKPSYIQLTGGLQIDFSTTGPNRCRAPFPVTFANPSTGPGTLSYLWTFGDGGTSTQQTPTHTYAASGAYTVSLAVTSSNGCTDTVRRTNFINIQNITTTFTAPDSICVRSPINFNNTSAPAPQSSAWTFGDGTTSAATNPVKAFTTPGTYTVQVLNTYSYCTDSFSKPIRIIPRPVAGFMAPVTAQCKPPLAVAFSNTSSNAVSYLWNFGDGNTSTQASPNHNYTAYGNYDVTLIVTNASGCTDTLRQPAFVRIQQPVITFPSLPQNGCIPYTLTFTPGVNTLDNVTSYLWEFGDGNTSILASPTHTYPLQGAYKVKLTITTSTGCTETDSLPNAIVVGRIPTVDFTAVPNPVCTFGQVQFTALFSEGSTFLWQFGDSTNSSAQNPVHQYTDTGSYNVSLTVVNNGCSVTTTKPAFIRSKPPIANFGYTNDCQNRRRFLFSDSSIGATSWLWNFGDGTTSTLQNPTHTFPAFASYTVTLTAIDDTCSHTKTFTLNLFDESPTFTADRRVACKAAAINFTPQSTNLTNIVTYAWDFGNGTSSTTQNPQVIYTTSGNYDVSLVTTDYFGCRDTATQNGYIRVNGPASLFAVANNNGCKGLLVSFYDRAQSDGVNAITSRTWFYGDGTSQTFPAATDPQHTYANPGSYAVKLVVTDAAGCKDSVSYSGLVNTSSPKAAFVSADTLACLGSSASFTDSSTGISPLIYAWEFGDNATSNSANPSHIYADTGLYTIKLKITDVYGCSDSVTRLNYIRILETDASFTVSDSLGGCTPFEVRFTNTSQFYASSAWDLAVANSTVTSPAQVYNVAGTYNIKLTVTGRGGCTDSAFRTIRIFDAAATTYSYTPFTGCKPLQLTGTVNSPANLDFIWDFGDGFTDTTTAATITHTYNVFGNFVPKLLLSDSGNCLIPLIGTDTVRILGVNAKFGWNRRQFCDSGTVSFIDSTTFNDPVISYGWNFGDGGTDAIPSPVHSYTAPGLYTVSLALRTQQGCLDTFAINNLVKVVESPSIFIDADTVICQNDLVEYTGVFNRPDTSAVRWAWTFPNGVSSSLQLPARQTFSTAGTFAVQAIATNTSGCADTASTSLRVNPLPLITIPSPQITPLATPILLPAAYTNTIVTYDWTPIAGLSCTDCAQPFASPKFNTLYTVTATDDNGCKNTGKVQVIVLCQGSLVFVPNTFSPNGDGSNDVFYVRGKGLNRVKSLRIFNRWGETVFEKQNFGVNDPAVGWDGTYKGKKLSADVYVYQVEVFCDNSEIIRFDGSVNLLQ